MLPSPVSPLPASLTHTPPVLCAVRHSRCTFPHGLSMEAGLWGHPRGCCGIDRMWSPQEGADPQAMPTGVTARGCLGTALLATWAAPPSSKGHLGSAHHTWLMHSGLFSASSLPHLPLCPHPRTHPENLLSTGMVREPLKRKARSGHVSALVEDGCHAYWFCTSDGGKVFRMGSMNSPCTLST